MTFFVDANIFIYAATNEPQSEPCLELLRAISEKGADGRTSVSVLEEVWHVELSGRLRIDGATRQALEIMQPVIAVPEQALELALALPAERLDANDRLHAATCIVHGIDTIVTADSAFDELKEPRRLDPGDAVAELLA